MKYTGRKDPEMAEVVNKGEKVEMTAEEWATYSQLASEGMDELAEVFGEDSAE